MAYVERVLLANERVTHRPAFSRFAVFGAPTVQFVALMSLWAAARALAAAYLMPDGAHDLERWFWWLYWIGVGVFAGRLAFSLSVRFIRLVFSELAVTNLRFMEKSGIFDIDFWSTDIEKIVRVAIRQPLLGRLFNYGDITIVTVGEVEHTTQLVSAPIALQKALHARMSASAAPASAIERPG